LPRLLVVEQIKGGVLCFFREKRDGLRNVGRMFLGEQRPQLIELAVVDSASDLID